jgi:hypothetical protein
MIERRRPAANWLDAASDPNILIYIDRMVT